MTRHERPSDDLPMLAWQLRTSLENLRDDADGPDARDFRRFLRRAVALGWRAAATGKFTAVREVIDLVREARPMVDDASPKLSPRALAAVEIQQALAALYVGEDELREIELENRLTNRGRHPTERAVLEVLAGAERPLRQKEVFDRMPHEGRPTLARVGQILRELYDHGFTRRQLARARGHSEAAHYQLAPRGLALCEQLGVEPAGGRAAAKASGRTAQLAANFKIAPASIAALVEAWLGPPQFRRIVRGLFQSAQNQSVGRWCLEKLRESPPPEVGREQQRAPVLAEKEFFEERSQIETTQDVIESDVQLVEAS